MKSRLNNEARPNQEIEDELETLKDLYHDFEFDEIERARLAASINALEWVFNLYGSEEPSEYSG